MQANILFGALARKYRENVQFDLTRFKILLDNTGHVKKGRLHES